MWNPIANRRWYVIFVSLAASAFAASSFAAEEHDDTLKSRLEYVQKLIVDSSAAKKVEASENARALAARDRALHRYDQAVEAHESGNTKSVDVLLTEAVKLMFDAVAMTNQSDSTDEKAGRDYENRRDSVEALLEAHQRISQEKRQQNNHEALRTKVEIELAAGDTLVQAGDIDGARQRIDKAYADLQLGIGDLRGGDTLVRTLEFENAEEEYLYEIDRNDTHLMLVQILLGERMKDENVQKRADPILQQAAILRTEAEEHAASGEFQNGIRLLESSTRELVKAIRSAGVYIPG